MDSSTNLVWIDLEMTGLNPEQDVILEIALIITDANLTIVHEGPEIVIHQSEEKLALMDSWVREQHGKSGLTEKVRASTISNEQAEQQVLEVIMQFCQRGRGVLAGNSVWQDRSFMRLQMPRITDYLHYRLIDVTSFKEVIKRWYPDDKRWLFPKKDTHRAMEDIRESIAELQHYRTNFFVK